MPFTFSFPVTSLRPGLFIAFLALVGLIASAPALAKDGPFTLAATTTTRLAPPPGAMREHPRAP